LPTTSVVKDFPRRDPTCEHLSFRSSVRARNCALTFPPDAARRSSCHDFLLSGLPFPFPHFSEGISFAPPTQRRLFGCCRCSQFELRAFWVELEFFSLLLPHPFSSPLSSQLYLSSPPTGRLGAKTSSSYPFVSFPHHHITRCLTSLLFFSSRQDFPRGWLTRPLFRPSFSEL